MLGQWSANEHVFRIVADLDAEDRLSQVADAARTGAAKGVALDQVVVATTQAQEHGCIAAAEGAAGESDALHRQAGVRGGGLGDLQHLRQRAALRDEDDAQFGITAGIQCVRR